MSSALPAPERRRRTRRMMDEDEHDGLARQAVRDELAASTLKRTRAARADASAAGHSTPRAPPTPPSSTSRRRTTSNPSASASTSSPVPRSPKVLVTLAGRVYRPPDPLDLRTRAEVEADLLLSEPSETIEDLMIERRERKRREIEMEMKREKLKGKGRMLAFDSDDEGDASRAIKAPRLDATPTKQSSLAASRARATTPPCPSLLPDLGSSPSASLGLPFAFKPTSTTSPPLPPSLIHLLSLHTALERALILHLSTHGSSIASTVSSVHPSSSSATVRMTNLIDLPTLGRMLESSGKRFGEQELRRVCWVWEGCGELRLDSEDELEVKEKDRDDEAGGMGFLITRSRLSKAGKVSSTYGLGISVALRTNPQLPKFELLPPTSPSRAGKERERAMPPSPSSVGKGRDGMSIVALWTQGKEARRREFERRLKEWAAARGPQAEPEQQVDEDLRWATQLPSHLLRDIPCAELPDLAPAVLAIPSTSTPSPKKPSATGPSTPRDDTEQASLPVVSPKDFVKALMEGRPVKSKAGTAADRDKARRERIQAKQLTQRQSAYHASLSALSSGESSPSKKRSLKPSKDVDEPDPALLSAQELFKQRAMLSRLGSVADVVAMRCGTRPTRFDDVCAAIANSPLLNIGFDEAAESLVFLAAHFAEFCYVKTVPSGAVGGERWMCLVSGQAGIAVREVKERVRAELARGQEEA
ncbi:hypothetical protein JCM5296_000812 [Sporobolomyces johnsonii]